jgi:hypothetical protein
MIRLTDTRFVIITHNPITMARMNRLLGVTMAERGVSQLVSVDLETAEKLARRCSYFYGCSLFVLAFCRPICQVHRVQVRQPK